MRGSRIYLDERIRWLRFAMLYVPLTRAAMSASSSVTLAPVSYLYPSRVEQTRLPFSAWLHSGG